MRLNFFELAGVNGAHIPVLPVRDRHGRLLPRAISRQAFATFRAVIDCISTRNFAGLSYGARCVLVVLRDDGKLGVNDIARAVGMPRESVSFLLRKTLLGMGLVFKCVDGQWIITPSGYALSMKAPWRTPRGVTLTLDGRLEFEETDLHAIERILLTCEHWQNDMDSRVLSPLEEFFRNTFHERGPMSTNAAVKELERDRKCRTSPDAQISHILTRPHCGMRRCKPGERVYYPLNGKVTDADGGELLDDVCLDGNWFLQLLSLPDNQRIWSVFLFEHFTTTKSLA